MNAQLDQTAPMCIAKCGFYGSAELNFHCSSCFKLAAHQTDQKQKVSQKNRNRCFQCRRKIGLTGCECRCGFVFCTEHRFADDHACTYDYQSHARLQLTEQNPVVKYNKVEKI